MNKFIQAIKKLDIPSVSELLKKNPEWLGWSEENGKNALHYLCGLDIAKDPQKIEASFQLLKLLLDRGMDMNAVHQLPDNCGFFPATPLWYAYTRGRNETLYTYLLEKGANPNHCLFAIAWNDDVQAANLFKKYGASLADAAGGDTPFLAAFTWKRFNIASWFLENGVDVNIADSEGNTALFYAVKRKYKLEQIDLLIQFGADFNKENNDGISPKKLAELNNQSGVLRLEKRRLL
ncbi:ankyrin repeat domain-containing protein [Spirosoma endbachense]|uniref:Uncharacterized protein n=1 Tax=Spirosoma endbachense TaxID=2666025 RepID=A0A6P1WB57_9BACT|nr:ankyrin repeat domain-containing protein [Spirosoma endbachense]QHW00997.1 hypothetical protein GJR95_40855 [Spirosoma endbachense]